MFEFKPVPKPSHKRRVDKRVDRNKFTKRVRDQIKDHFEDTCQMCGGRGCHIHHVRFRSQGGRGVFSNSLLVCNSCHKKIHLDNELAKHWREVYKKKYGNLYYMDAEDIRSLRTKGELEKEDRAIKEWLKHNGQGSEDLFS